MPTREELKMLQALPLSLKVRRTQQRIREWVNVYGTDGVYVSFSGGKDSTVLLHLVRELYPDVPAVFVNTGLEYPEIQKFVRGFDNVEILRPKMAFPEVIAKYGYPFIGKEISQLVFDARIADKRGTVKSVAQQKLDGVWQQKTGGKSRYNYPKYNALRHVDFWLSHMCCKVMKKSTSHDYERQTKRHPFIGSMAEESELRRSQWLKEGCNTFNAKRNISTPMAFWTEQDVLEYIKVNRIEVASVYGDVVIEDANGFQYDSCLSSGCKYKTTGCQRTGCIFCGFGAHLGKGEGKFVTLKRTHPKQYDYCMGGGAYDQDGIWKPSKEGLGMAHVIDELCRIYGKDFIRY